MKVLDYLSPHCIAANSFLRRSRIDLSGHCLPAYAFLPFSHEWVRIQSGQQARYHIPISIPGLFSVSERKSASPISKVSIHCYLRCRLTTKRRKLTFTIAFFGLARSIGLAVLWTLIGSIFNNHVRPQSSLSKAKLCSLFYYQLPRFFFIRWLSINSTQSLSS